MIVEYIEETTNPFPFHALSVFSEIGRAVCQMEHVSYSLSVTVSLLSDAQIQEKNRMFRQIDDVTDVLSFPLLPFQHPSDFSFLAGKELQYQDPETNAICLGDVLLARERIEEQAEAYGHSLKRETAFLFAHSLLHLLGYDHETEEEATIMEEKQEHVLLQVNLPRLAD